MLGASMFAIKPDSIAGLKNLIPLVANTDWSTRVVTAKDLYMSHKIKPALWAGLNIHITELAAIMCTLYNVTAHVLLH